jgi:hypothetical protein
MENQFFGSNKLSRTAVIIMAHLLRCKYCLSLPHYLSATVTHPNLYYLFILLLLLQFANYFHLIKLFDFSYFDLTNFILFFLTFSNRTVYFSFDI